ncbi:DUF6175 family protein [Flavobacterium sp.]|uniref:DUF6175 family protein n=1 Tax=Flavobacterium sp. TaxID=239 RepID=UPI002488407C|nr:DUF6175 family protein [Flavobacterium sp.]MDI1315789.1 DUF6175 family protein [Flavobacterium sp.]
MTNKYFKNNAITLMLLLSSTLIFSQAVNKPSIMVFPSDDWMENNNYMDTVDNQGTQTKVPNYARALLNDDLTQVISTIEGLMKERNYPLTNLSSTLKDITDRNALANAETSEDGASTSEGPKDKLLSTARPDIVLYVFWKINSIGPKKSITFRLSGIDAGTNKPQATADGTGNELIGATLPVMLKTSVLSHIDNFNSQLMTFFEEMQVKGREVSVEIQVFDGAPKNLNSEINEDGDELSDDLKRWMKSNTVNGAFTLQTKTATKMQLVSVRIPLRGEDGAAYTTDDFGTALRKYLKKTYKFPSSNYSIGTGKAVIVIGGKSQ